MRHADDSNTTFTEEEQHVLRRLEKWLDDVALFLYGYVSTSLSDNIRKWREDNTIPKSEDEIWIGSLRCLAVNKLKLAQERSETMSLG
jgi:hypothetical protein